MTKRSRIPVIALLCVAIGILALAISKNRSGAGGKTIVIATLMSQPALDEVLNGIKDELRERGYDESHNVRIIERNANGQIQLAATIANEIAAQDPTIIVPITTPLAQSVAKVARCPIVFAAVTDPVGTGWSPT